MGMSGWTVAKAWLVTAIIAVALILEGPSRIGYSQPWRFLAVTAFLVPQLVSLGLTIRWLSKTRPHATWFSHQIVLMWVAIGALWLTVRGLVDYADLVFLLFGGGVAIILAFATTWTWLSGREGQ